MLTLIRRELYDHISYLILALLISFIIIGMVILMVLWDMPEASFALATFVAVGLLGIFSFLGTAQMYSDRANRISALLATLAVTRSRVLAARVLAGAIVIVLSFLPVAIAAVALLHTLVPPLAFYWRMILEVGTTMVLLGFACYCAGLSVGWTGNKVLLLAADLVLFVLIVPVFLVKGFGIEAIVILLLLVGAMLLRTWKSYATVSL
jgi:hypothetical protein